MESARPQLLIVAELPDALCSLFGISLLERLLRVVQRLGFQEAMIVSSSPEQIAAHLAKPSWARAGVNFEVKPGGSSGLRENQILPEVGRVLVVSAGFYYDARLLGTLARQEATTVLTDSNPAPDCARLGRYSSFAAALVDQDWLRRNQSARLLDQLVSDANSGQVAACDAAKQATYVVSLRKHVRPVFFPAPSPDLIWVAERFPRDAAQNGVLDLPGFLDSPIEDWIVARLCRTSIRPNHVTFVTMLIGLAVTALFVTGHLWTGVILAYTIEVLDGVDGKLARTKVETTATGEWEHVSDYCIELSWWIALAWHFQSAGFSSAYWLLLLLFSSDVIDRLAKRVVKKKVGRNLDDVANFDRFVRWIGARRNINVWILIAALALGDPVDGYVFFCWWTAATAAAHLVRAGQIAAKAPFAGAA